jgi:hypothetical protein
MPDKELPHKRAIKHCDARNGSAANLRYFKFAVSRSNSI